MRPLRLHIRFGLVARLLLLTLTAAAPVLAQTASDTLSLSTCISRSLDQSPKLQASQAQAAAQQSSVEAVRSTLYPTLSAEASARHSTKTGELQLPSFGPAAPQIVSLGVQDTYDLTARAAIPLYTGGALRSNLHAAEAEAHAATATFAADSLALVYQVRTAFYQALQARANVDAIELTRNRLQRTLDLLRGSVDTGMASEEDLLPLKARIAELDGNHAHAEGTLTAASLRLGGLLGEPETSIIPRGDLHQSLLEDNPTGSVFTQDFGERPELDVLRYRSDALRAREGATKAAWLPSISGFVQYSYARPGLNFASDTWMDYGAVGVSAHWLLWDFGGRSARIESARLAVDAANSGLDQLQRDLTTAREVSAARLEAAKRAHEHAAKAAGLQADLRDHVQDRYDHGRATLRELLDAEDDVKQANLNETAAAADVRLAETEWLYATAH